MICAMIELGEFLEIKRRMSIDDSETPVSYGQIIELQNGTVKIGLYDHNRRFVGDKTLTKSEIRGSDVFTKTCKDPREISWVFRKELDG